MFDYRHKSKNVHIIMPRNGHINLNTKTNQYNTTNKTLKVKQK